MLLFLLSVDWRFVAGGGGVRNELSSCVKERHDDTWYVKTALGFGRILGGASSRYDVICSRLRSSQNLKDHEHSALRGGIDLSNMEVRGRL